MMLKFFSAAMLSAAYGASIIETARATGVHTQFVKFIEGNPGAFTLLNGTGKFTVFAPTDEAFTAAALPAGADADLVLNLLSYHVIAGEVKSGDLPEGPTFATSLMNGTKYVTLGGLGQRIPISKAAGVVKVGSGQVTGANVTCDNGIIHVVDKVLYPLPLSASATAMSVAALKELVDALKKAELVDILDAAAGVTIFAPTNDAMLAANWSSLSKEALADVLKYHVVPAVAFSTDLKAGEQMFETLQKSKVTVNVVSATSVKVNNANVVLTSANVLVKNGVVHVIDAVLLPPAAGPTAAPAPAGSPTPVPSSAAATSAFASAVAVAVAVAVM